MHPLHRSPRLASFVRRESDYLPRLSTHERKHGPNTHFDLNLTLYHQILGFNRPPWDRQTELTKADLVRTERGRAWPLDGWSAGGPLDLDNPLLFYFKSIFYSHVVCECVCACGGLTVPSVQSVNEQQLSSRFCAEPRCGTHAGSGRWVPCGSPLMLGTAGKLYSPGRWLWQQQGRRRRLSPQQLLHPWTTGLPFFFL